MKIVWLAANASYTHTSLALPLIERACDGLPGLTFLPLHTTIADDVQTMTAHIDALDPNVVAATLFLFNRDVVMQTLARLKTLRPACTVVVGGPECLGDNRELLAASLWVDIAVRGEGEAAFPVILRRLAADRPLDGIPGVTSRAGDRVDDTPGTAVFTGWDRLASPTSSPLFEWGRPFVQIETARGCDFGCTYCTSCGSAPVRLRPLDAVRDELREIEAHRIREVRVLDRTFNTSPRRTCALLDLFRGFPQITFHLEIHPALLGPGVRDALAAAPHGNLHIEAGLQTTCDAALRAVSRAGTGAEALEGVRFLVSCADRFDTHVDLLAGLPGQTFQSVADDAAALMRIGPAEIQLETVKALPGTPFRDHASTTGVHFSPLPPYEVLRTPGLSTVDLLKVTMLSRVIDRFYNQPDLQPALRRAVTEDTACVPDLLEECLKTSFLNTPASLRKRFLFLFMFLQDRAPDAAECLQIQWMTAGLSPQHGICRAERWTQPLPDDAVLVSGSLRDIRPDACRIWTLELPGGQYWFVYYRADRSARAGAVARRSRTASPHV